MSATKTLEWAVRVGRDAVAEGFPFHPARHWSLRGIPDFRDRLTEKACELWFEDVAREVYGDSLKWVVVDIARNGGVRVVVFTEGSHPAVSQCADTRAEACIAACRAMLGHDGDGKMGNSDRI